MKAKQSSGVVRMKLLPVHRLLAIGAILVALFTLSNRASAQNESGARTFDKRVLQRLGLWYDPAKSFFRTPIPIIRSLPPLNSGMPWDVLASYIYMDSLARFDRNRITETTLERWSQERLVTDTLKYMAKYLYKLVDYDPNRFTQYIDEVTLNYGARYSASLRTISSWVGIALFDGLARYNSLKSDASRAWVLALMESSYILRVRVLAVDSMATGSSSAKYIYRVTADVLDTLKGRVIQPCPIAQQETKVKPGQRSVLPAPSNTCMQFVYLNHLYSNPRYTPSGAPDLYSARDPEFAQQPDSLFRMKPGQEAIVFIRHNNQLVDSTYDYYHLMLEPRASLGALAIINGKVRDVNRIWSKDLMLDYSEWKLRFLELRDNILNGTY